MRETRWGFFLFCVYDQDMLLPELSLLFVTDSIGGNGSIAATEGSIEAAAEDPTPCAGSAGCKYKKETALKKI